MARRRRRCAQIDRSLRGHQDHRQGRDGRRVQGARSTARSRGRGQDDHVAAAAGPAGAQRVPRALPARGQGRGEDVASGDRHDLRRRRRRGFRRAVHGARIPAGRVARRPPRSCAHAAVALRDDRARPRVRARVRASPAHRASRRQAGERAARRRQPLEARRFRHRAAARQRPHAGRHLHGHAGLLAARGDPRGPLYAAGRRVRVGRVHVRAAQRSHPVRGARHQDDERLRRARATRRRRRSTIRRSPSRSRRS